MDQPFSKRFGLRGPAPDIRIREDAPPELRAAAIQVAREVGLSPHPLREIVCRVLRQLPDPGNWSEYPNVWGEVQGLISNCSWYKVYDIIEAIYENLGSAYGRDPSLARSYEIKMNDVFEELGIGWQMVGGTIQTRGDEPFEASMKAAADALRASGRATATSELHEALRDLSRRPESDLTGAVQHAVAALECVARDVCGDTKATLGRLLSAHSDRLAIPKPLDTAVEKAWGYASEMGRHVREGFKPTRPEAELVVFMSAAVATYLCSRAR